MADANLNGASGARSQPAGKAPVSKATTQILPASGKAIGTVTAVANPRVDTGKVATGRIIAGEANGRIAVAVTSVKIAAIVAVITLVTIEMIVVVPTGQIAKIIGEDAAIIVMTAGNLAGSQSVRGVPPIAGESKMRPVPAEVSTGVASALIAITAAIIAEMIGGMNAASGKHKHRALESILLGYAIPATGPKSGATITSLKFLPQ